MFNKGKFDNLFDLMVSNKFDAIMIAPSSDLEYLINYRTHVDERLNCLILLKNRDYFHITPMVNYEEVKEKYSENSKLYFWGDGEGFLETVVKSFRDHGLENKTIGVNFSIRAIDMLEIGELINLSFKSAHHLLEDFRVVKTDIEIENMKKAGAIADDVMKDIKMFIKPGITEQNVIDEITRLYSEKGADSLSFEPICAAGPNSSMPHYNAGTRVIEVGDNVVIDCGCRFNNVCSDTSRTFFVGEPSEEQRKIYEICRKATFSAQKAVKAGMKAGDVDKVARDIIEKEGYSKNFLNRTGHGIGFSVHEAPYIKPNNERILNNGMAFSIEPGIYLPGKFGMRIENIIVLVDGVGVSMNKSAVAIEYVTINL